MSSQEIVEKYRKARNDVLTAIRAIRNSKLSNANIKEKRVSYMKIRFWR